MIVNFYPCKNRMARALEQCASPKDLERIVSFCSTCIYRVFEESLGRNFVPMTYVKE